MPVPSPRQAVRKGILIFSFILFPIIINYFSPALSLMGALRGLITASLIVFFVLFLGALFLGRAFCGWLCPLGGLQEICFSINYKQINRKRTDWIKYLIWIPWIGSILTLLALNLNSLQLDFFYNIENGISVSEPRDFIVYFIVVLIVMLLALAGRRGFCHSTCWVAPFMILGRKLRNIFKWPALRLRAETKKCQHCQACTKHCAMSIDVHNMVNGKSMEHPECILCGMCVDACPSKVIKYSFSIGS